MLLVLINASRVTDCRFAILPPLLGVIINTVVAYSVIHTDASIVFFLVGDFLYGCCGSYSAMSMSCFAYVADRLPAERRMLRITLLQLCMLVAGIVSPIGIGPVVAAIGVENLILGVLSVSIINFIYVFLCLRNDDRKVDGGVPVAGDDDDQTSVRSLQSYPDDERAGPSVNMTGGDHRHLPRFRHAAEPRSDDNAAVDLSHSLNRDIDPQPRSELQEPRVERQTRTLCEGVRHVISLFLSPGRSRFRLNILMATFFFSALPTYDLSLLNLFEMNKPLCWTVGEIGMFTGTMLAIGALGALIVMPLMKRCGTDWHIAITGSVAAVITYVYRFFVRDSLMMYLCKCLIFLFLPTWLIVKIFKHTRANSFYRLTI